MSARLLSDRRFWPVFWTQFAGALNDNLFKNALAMLVTYKGLSVLGLGSESVVALSGGLFIIPFFVLSATAGQLADKYEKARLMRWVKLAEIGIMGLGAWGFLTANAWLLLGVLVLMGVHSTFFGPAKYSILPEQLRVDELVGGNAFVEMGTFVAILIGTIGGGVLIALPDAGPVAVSVAVLGVAVLGWWASLAIRGAPAADPSISIDVNPIRPTLSTFAVARQTRSVFLSVLGISWFWFLGASFLTVLFAYAKDVLGGSEHVVTLMLGLFCVGIGLGSMLCERLSDRKLELGLVPLGSIGMTVFALDLFLVGRPYGVAGPVALEGVAEIMRHGWMIRLMVDLFGIAVFSGFYTVPLYTLIQQNTPPTLRSRVIAANNILNSLFMVAASMMLVGLFAAGGTIPHVYLILAVLNALVAVYIYTLLPEFLWRFLAWIIASIMYRQRVSGRQHLPLEGPAVLVCNHVSFVDWLLVASSFIRPVRFVMHHTYFDMPVVGFLFRHAKVIPIAPAHEDQALLERAFDKIAAELQAGEVVCIFPEGKLTRSGELNTFRRGIERIVERTPVPVIPMALVGMWGSFFSHRDNAALKKPFRRIWSHVELRIGEPLPAAAATAQDLAARVAELGGFRVPEVDAS